MDNIKSIKNKITMPSNCPFCGEPLSKNNAAIDHILPPNLGGKNTPDNLRYICKACNVKKSNKYNLLFEYYYRLLNNTGEIGQNKIVGMDYMLRSMSDKDLTALEEKIKEKDKTYLRLMMYANAISKIHDNKIEEEPSDEELSEVMKKALNSYDNYDFNKEIREKINGNTFIFNKDFPIEKYRSILAEYGNEEQGEIYSVYVDDKGRLVVY